MKWRRRQYLIDQKFQWRFIRLIIMPLVIGVIIITLADYYFIWSLFTSPWPGRYENMGLISLKIVGYILLYGLCLLIPMVVVVGVLVSHRLAGPLFNIERALRAIAGGDLTKRVRLREKDELKNLETAVNEMVAVLADKFEEIEKALTLLEENISRLEGEAGKELPNINKIREGLKTLSEALAKGKDRLAGFKSK